MAEPQRRPGEPRRQQKDSMPQLQLRSKDALRRARIKMRYSQGDLALLCGKSQQMISKLESGATSTVTEAFGMKIAQRLNVPWEQLFEDPDSMPLSTNSVDSGCEDQVAS